MRTVRLACSTASATLLLGSSALAGSGGWVTFFDQTPQRFPTPLNDPLLSTLDVEEKDYAWGDVDQDGDIDLVCVRKTPFTNPGGVVSVGRRNVLFMNEGVADGHAIDGVLVDRTTLYAVAADDGGQGFLDETNDRDVVLVDVNGDNWLDLVTAVTLTDNADKDLSHPRVYINLGEDAGVWQGFRYESARLPVMHATAGPRFCSVAAGDMTGDDAPDLYFGDYDSGPTQIEDFNNRLFINNGSGFFVDESVLRMGSIYNYDGVGPETYLFSAFGAASAVADMNGDGQMDVVKQTALNPPQHVAVVYNNHDLSTSEGMFTAYQEMPTNTPYFISVGDLNGDGKMDIVVTEDGTDLYMLNQGNDASGQAIFASHAFPSTPSAGFGSNSVIADLNLDGHNDVLIADVDVDITGCSRRMHIYRNMGDTPDVTFQEQGEVIPNTELQGTHDVAVFDIDGDGRLDLVIGRCTGTQIWMNQPPTGLAFSYPSGLPTFMPPDASFTIDVQVSGIDTTLPTPGSGKLFYSTDGTTYIEGSMTHQGGNLYEATLPASACTEKLTYYFTSDADGGGTFSDPPNAPNDVLSVTAAHGTAIALRDEMEGDTSAWTVVNDNGLTLGFWEAADPHGVLFNTAQAVPEDDATQGSQNVKAFVTHNGSAGDPAGTTDVDGGPTHLISPVIDLAGTDALISYARWFFTDGGVSHVPDSFEVSVSNGGDWETVTPHTTQGTGSEWETVSFQVSDWVTPSATVQVRFSVADSPNNSVTEACVDNFQVDVFLCTPPCPADLNGDGSVNVLDLLDMLTAWGANPGHAADLNGDGSVNVADVLELLTVWGPC